MALKAPKSKATRSKASAPDPKRKQAVEDQLRRNFGEAYNPFVSAFYETLTEEAEPVPTVEVDPEADKKAFDASLEPGTDGEKFETEGAMVGVQSSYVKKAKSWVGKLEEFSTWLNAIDGNSLNKQLNEVDRPGSLFRGISRKASDNLVKIAGEIARLKEIIEGYVLGAPKKQREQEQQSANF
jgi:hypothetical protein